MVGEGEKGEGEEKGLEGGDGEKSEVSESENDLVVGVRVRGWSGDSIGLGGKFGLRGK